MTLQVANAAAGQPSITFEGKWAPAQPGIDCVAIFDGSRWRLEKLAGTASNIRSSVWAQDMNLTDFEPRSQALLLTDSTGPRRISSGGKSGAAVAPSPVAADVPLPDAFETIPAGDAAVPMQPVRLSGEPQCVS